MLTAACTHRSVPNDVKSETGQQQTETSDRHIRADTPMHRTPVNRVDCVPANSAALQSSWQRRRPAVGWLIAKAYRLAGDLQEAEGGWRGETSTQHCLKFDRRCRLGRTKDVQQKKGCITSLQIPQKNGRKLQLTLFHRDSPILHTVRSAGWGHLNLYIVNSSTQTDFTQWLHARPRIAGSTGASS